MTMATKTAKRSTVAQLAKLKRDDLRAACLQEAMHIHELESQLIDVLQAAGDDLQSYSVGQFIGEALTILDWCGDGGLLGEEIAEGDADAKKTKRDLTAFVKRWRAVLAARKAARA
jgi:hypothetical protein